MNENKVVGIFLVVLLLGGIVLLLRKPEGVEEHALQLNKKVAGQNSIRLIEDRPSKPARRYQNAETWDIDWNEDGLPKRITIHRDAIQS